jgi:hypothetical protein
MNSGFIFTKFIVQNRDHQNFLKIINKNLRLNLNFNSRKLDPFKIGRQEFKGSGNCS